MTEINLDNYGIGKDLKTKTGSYVAIDVSVVPMQLHMVSDMATGGKRKRRLGMTLSANILTELNEEQEPLIMARGQQHLFIDADNLDDLKERAHAEIDAIFKYTKDVIDGKVPRPGMESDTKEAPRTLQDAVDEVNDLEKRREEEDLEEQRDTRSSDTAPTVSSN